MLSPILLGALLLPLLTTASSSWERSATISPSAQYPTTTTIPSPAKASAKCASFAQSLSLPNTTVNFVEFVPAGTNLTGLNPPEYNLTKCNFASALVTSDMCRVAMYVATSGRSGITLEAWLPTNWTGRFLSTGNGGVSGCIQYTDMAYTAGLGFATVGANNGHNGTTGEAFLNNPDVIHDFASRSVHTGVVLGKSITAQFYGSPHRKSYYLGCSTGGRQGFKSVQEYPLDFDGVVAGAPALDMAYLTSWSASFYTYFGDANCSSYIPPGLAWDLVHKEILKQCDGIDGALDGILEDPDLCRFRPEALLCASSATITNTTTCLTKPQVVALRKTYSDYYGVNGELIYPRMQPGSEAIAQFLYYTSGAFPYSVDWFRYVVYNDTTWDASKYNITDAFNAGRQNPFNIQTWEGDLTSFRAAGGKLLHYHGLADFIITSDNSPRYYNHVADTMGLPSSELDDFYRFFRISGMGHCGGGEGAHMIGQNAQESAGLDPQGNVLMAMVNWVEKGRGPESITGTKYVNDVKEKGVAFVRTHCKYPKRNVYKGPGNYTLPESWECI